MKKKISIIFLIICIIISGCSVRFTSNKYSFTQTDTLIFINYNGEVDTLIVNINKLK